MHRWRLALVLLSVLSAALASGASALAAAPAVTAIHPNNGPAAGGTAVTITGDGFIAGSTVAFGQASATGVTIESSTSMTATSPSGSATVQVTVTNANGTSAAVPRDQFAYDPPPSDPWLGLNGNSSTYLGPVDRFVEHGIAYDRSGAIEWAAGELAEEHGQATERGQALSADIQHGMIPVVTIEYRGDTGEFSPDPSFPTEANGSNTLREYVQGFVQSAASILAAHPGKTILFEPINEPWGATTPQYNGGEYADVIAKLLPAARQAHIPLSSVYVAAYGRHWVSQMYAAQPSLQSEVQGWYLHPYGSASASVKEDSGGIQSLPHVQAEMTSGQNNIIVSEIGYCDLDVNEGRGCGAPQVAHGSEAAEQLSQTLISALRYHQAGWLRALLVYSRNDGGWAMQVPGGELTAQGEALEAFAEGLQQSPPAAQAPTPLVGNPSFTLPPVGVPGSSGNFLLTDEIG